MGNRTDVAPPHYQPTVDLTIRSATEQDAIDMAPHLRRADLAEVQAHSGVDATTALAHGVRVSDDPKVVLFRGKPTAIFGVVPQGGLVDESGEALWPSGVPPLDGACWLLGTDDIHIFQRQFLRWSRHWLADIGDGYACIGNMVDLRNTVHVRWLKWLKFTFIDSIRYGPEGRVFLRFYKEASNV